MNDSPPESFSYEVLAGLHAFEERLETALEPLGLSLAKFGALARLVAAGEPLPLSTLAERCACVRSNITQLVDRLEVEKLVARADDPTDRRSVLAELTAEGRARHAAGVKAIRKVERDVLAGLPASRRDDFMAFLRALHSGV